MVLNVLLIHMIKVKYICVVHLVILKKTCHWLVMTCAKLYISDDWMFMQVPYCYNNDFQAGHMQETTSEYL